MKQLTRISLSKYFLASATVLVFITAGCNSDGKKEGDVTTTVGADSATPPTDMTTTPTTATGDTTGRMQPNPAKKGGKGKVSVAEQKAMANNTASTMDNTGVYSSAEIMPAYPGGYNSMADFFNNNVEYPQDATDNGIEGTVDVNFAVDETGKLSNAKVVSPKIGYGVEEEALRVVNKMPTWTPGRIKGKNVKTYYTLPVTFQLN